MKVKVRELVCGFVDLVCAPAVERQLSETDCVCEQMREKKT